MEFDQVALGVRYIDESNLARAADRHGDDGPEFLAAGCEHFAECFRHIFNKERDMPESLTVCGRGWVLAGRNVFEYFKRGTILAVAGQAEMEPANPRAQHRCRIIDRGSGQITLGRHRHTAENGFVETRQQPPVAGDEVRVYISCVHT